MNSSPKQTQSPLPASAKKDQPLPDSLKSQLPITEINGPKGAEPTRYGDWERKGRCIDF
jgi:hypothetical protein